MPSTYFKVKGQLPLNDNENDLQTICLGTKIHIFSYLASTEQPLIPK